MISSVRGTVIHVSSDAVVIELGGIGFSLSVPTGIAQSARVGSVLALQTNLVVREDSLTLYGFDTREALDVFGLLIGVTGVGPKSALGILSVMTVDEIASAVGNEDDAPFRKVSGIGPKTAKLITVQLAGKLHATHTAAAHRDIPSDVQAQVVTALAGLGWPERAATVTVSQVVQEAKESEKSNVAVLLRLALAALGPGKSGAGDE